MSIRKDVRIERRWNLKKGAGGTFSHWNEVISHEVNPAHGIPFLFLLIFFGIKGAIQPASSEKRFAFPGSVQSVQRQRAY